MSRILDYLQGLLKPRLDTATAEWFDGALRRTREAFSAAAFQADVAQCARRLGRQPLALSAAERAAMREADPDFDCAAWTRMDAGRAALILEAARALPLERFTAEWRDWLRYSDAAEQALALRLLAYLPSPERWLPEGLEACRTNMRTVFEAVACENPFPARFFTTPSFNQMMMKAYFLGVAAARVAGLAARRNDDLARMALDWCEERERAGRDVPPDLWRVVGGSGDPRALPALRRYREHAAAEHRREAALALGESPEKRA